MGKKADQERVSVFNSSITYLIRINELMQKSHEASVDDDDVFDWFMVLEQIHIEIDPRLNPDEIDLLEKLRVDTYKKYLFFKKKRANLNKLRNCVRPYHLQINRYAHAKGLILKDEETITMNSFLEQ